MNDLMTQEQWIQFAKQLLRHAGEGGLTREQIEAACKEWSKVLVGASMVELWMTGRITIGWQGNDLVMHCVKGGDA